MAKKMDLKHIGILFLSIGALFSGCEIQTPILCNESYKVTDETFEQEVLKSDKLVVVDFWSKYCGACIVLDNDFKKVYEQQNAKALGADSSDCNIKVVKVDTDTAVALNEKYASGKPLPLLVFIKDGQEIFRHYGRSNPEGLATLLDQVLSE